MSGRKLAAMLGALALTLTGCGESIAPDADELSEDDRAEIIQLLEESGFFSDEFGADGAAEDDLAAVGATSPAAQADAIVPAEARPPRHWGRRRGRPVRREITIEVDHETGTATVTKEVVFDGKFLLDITHDSLFNPTDKPLQESLIHTALFRRVPSESVDQNGRRWRLVRISPAEWVMTDPEKRTVNITRVEVWVNEELEWTVTDPSILVGVDDRIPTIRRGDNVVLRAWVDNTLDSGNDPDTYVFLHLFHAKTTMRAWIRVPMRRIEGDDGVYYERAWVARFTGRSRVAVDAIDAQTFMTESEDDYRANIWGAPYRIVAPTTDVAGG